MGFNSAFKGLIDCQTLVSSTQESPASNNLGSVIDLCSLLVVTMEGAGGWGRMEVKYSANKAYSFVNLSLLPSVICVSHLVFWRQWEARIRWTCKWDVRQFVHRSE